jgi:hypothetical protein
MDEPFGLHDFNKALAGFPELAFCQWRERCLCSDTHSLDLLPKTERSPPTVFQHTLFPGRLSLEFVSGKARQNGGATNPVRACTLEQVIPPFLHSHA